MDVSSKRNEATRLSKLFHIICSISHMTSEKDTDLWIIPAEIYKGIMKESAPVANYTNELMATRFSDVMWLIEQIMWKSLRREQIPS